MFRLFLQFWPNILTILADGPISYTKNNNYVYNPIDIFYASKQAEYDPTWSLYERTKLMKFWVNREKRYRVYGQANLCKF